MLTDCYQPKSLTLNPMTSNGAYPKGPCAQTVYSLAPKYLYRDYIKAKYTLLGYMDPYTLNPYR